MTSKQINFPQRRASMHDDVNVKIKVEQIYNYLFNRMENKLTDEGRKLLESAMIKPETIQIKYTNTFPSLTIYRTFDEFYRELENKEIAKIHFEHYKQKRLRNLLKIDKIMTNMNNPIEQLSNPYRFQLIDPLICANLHKNLKNLSRNKNLTFNQSINSSLDYSDNTHKHKHKKSKQGLTASTHNKTSYYNANEESNSKTLPQSDAFGIFQTEVIFDETPIEQPEKKIKSRQNKSHDLEPLKRYEQQRSQPGESIERFVKARQQAEEQAKEKIMKLNEMLQKEKRREQKAREYFQECMYERLDKMEKRQQRHSQVLMRVNDNIRSLDERRQSDYQKNLEEIQEKLNRQRAKEREISRRQFEKYYSLQGTQNKRSISTIIDGRENSMENIYDRPEVSLMDLERRINQGRERSMILKNEHIKESQRKEYDARRKAEDIKEKEQYDKMSKVIIKLNKYKYHMRHAQQDQEHKMDQRLEKIRHRHEMSEQIQKEQYEEREKKWEQIFEEEKNREQVQKEAQQKLLLNSMKKKELQKLREADSQELKDEQKYFQQLRKEKVLDKHSQIHETVSMMKEKNEKLFDIIVRKENQKRKYMLDKLSASPYEEMRIRYLQSDLALSK